MKAFFVLCVLGAIVCEITGTVVNQHLKYKGEEGKHLTS